MWNGLVRGKKTIKLSNTNVIDCCGVRRIWEFIQPDAYASYRIVQEAMPLAKKYAEDYKAYNYTFAHHMIYAIWSWVNKNVAYKYDEIAKYPDYWNDVWETYNDKWGDCEDASIACVSAIESMELTTHNVDLAIGFYIFDNYWYGHAFVIYNSPDFGREVVLECTMDTEVTPNFYIGLANSKYHPTVKVSTKDFKVVCECSYCKTMMEYLTSGTNKPRFISKGGVKPNISLVSAEPKRKSWWAKWI